MASVSFHGITGYQHVSLSSSSGRAARKSLSSALHLRSIFLPGTCSIALPKLRTKNVESSNKMQANVTASCKEVSGTTTNVQGLRFAVVVGRFNEFVTKALLNGALGAFKSHLVKEEDIDIVWVPGSYEIPVVAQTLAKSEKYSAVLCIGTVIRGETTHYEAVANSAASGVLSASLSSGIPCIFGVLTCENLEQALHRAGGKLGNKGAEAALTAIEMASLLKHQLPRLTEA